MSGFEEISDDLLETASLNLPYIASQIDHKYNVCAVCNVPMNKNNQGLECPVCHEVIQIQGDVADIIVGAESMLKTAHGSGRNSFQSYDNSRAQQKQILEQLVRFNEAYNGIKLPLSVLEQVAAKYNDIQKTPTEVFGPDGKVIGTKKFVRRSEIKDQILGAIIYYECIARGIARKKKDIARFMQLNSDGISLGETALRELHNGDKTVIPINADPSASFVVRYLTALELYNIDDQGIPDAVSANYKAFVDKILEIAAARKISHNSTQSSRVVGAIALLIEEKKLPITHTALSTACDGLRKTTYSKFTNEATKYRHLFGPAYNLLATAPNPPQTDAGCASTRDVVV